jgi:hypothetical protein
LKEEAPLIVGKLFIQVDLSLAGDSSPIYTFGQLNRHVTYYADWEGNFNLWETEQLKDDSTLD